MRYQRLLVVPTALAAMLLALACTSALPHRTLPRTAGTIEPPGVNPPSVTSVKKLANPDEQCRVKKSSVECHPEFTVATIEFDDKGRPHAPAQIEFAMREIRNASDGALIIVFVHGWKHDARICDGNMCCFREVLGFISAAETQMAHGRPPRQVIGIYLAWRGAATRVFGVKELTFWNRKRAAHAIGSAHDAGSVLLRVLDAYNQLNENHHSKGNRLVLIGHSFGAALLFDAVKPTLEQNLKKHSVDACTTLSPGVSGFGDLVVLVNPAFEVAHYQDLLDIAEGASPYCSHQTPLLLVASTRDFANRRLFPIGQFLHARFSPAKRTTIGNSKDHWSHRLTATDLRAPRGSREAGATRDCRCKASLPSPQAPLENQEIDQLLNVDLNAWTDFGSTQLASVGYVVHPYFPFLVASAAGNVINGHNGIFSDRFVDFLVRFVGLSDYKKIALERAKARAAVEPFPTKPWEAHR